MYDVGLRLPLIDFQEELLQKNGCSIQMLTPSAVNKMVAFEMIFRANNILPDFFFFKFFFRFSATGDKYTFSTHHGGYILVLDSKTPKNWQDMWLWINHEWVGRGHYRANNMSDVTPNLFPHNHITADLLKMIQVTPDEYSESILIGFGISSAWCA